MTLEMCAARLTALLARRPRRAKTRQYLAALPARAAIIVSPSDYAVETRQEKDARRYGEWEARGKPPSPPALPIRRRARSRERDPAYVSLMIQMIEAQNGRCAGCGKSILMTEDLDDPMRPTFDHVVPRSRGGNNEGNRVAMHSACNGKKSDSKPTGCEWIMLAAVNARLSPPSPMGGEGRPKGESDG